MSSIIHDLVSANQAYASTVSTHDKQLGLPPAKKYIVVTCMDARIHPTQALGMNLGDAHVIRNAGGCVKDAMRSIVISQQLLGTEEILVIKHKGCGMLTFENKDIHKVVKDNLGVSVDNIDYLPFKDLEQAVKDDVAYLKASPLVAEKSKPKITGWIYDVGTAEIKQVV